MLNKQVKLLIAFIALFIVTYILIENPFSKKTKEKWVKLIENAQGVELPQTSFKLHQEKWTDQEGMQPKISALTELIDMIESIDIVRELPSNDSYFTKPTTVHLITSSGEKVTLTIGDLTPTQESFYVKSSWHEKMGVMDLNLMASPVVAETQLELQRQKYDRFVTLINASAREWQEDRLIFMAEIGAFNRLSVKNFSQTFHPKHQNTFFNHLMAGLKTLVWIEREPATAAPPGIELDFLLEQRLKDRWVFTSDQKVYIESKKMLFKLNEAGFDHLFATMTDLYYQDPLNQEWFLASKIIWSPISGFQVTKKELK
jgi:hypothetical protein